MKFVAAFLLFAQLAFSQDCILSQAKTASIPAVDGNDLRCLARQSDKPNTLLFTFGIWCAPCREHFPSTLKFAKENQTELIVVLLEAEDDPKSAQAVEYLHNLDPGVRVVVVKDEVYGSKRNKKNKKFVTEMTPSDFEDIDCYSKHFLLDKSGQVTFVSSYKDNTSGDWKDETSTLGKMASFLVKNDAPEQKGAGQ